MLFDSIVLRDIVRRKKHRYTLYELALYLISNFALRIHLY
ncbi:hypothetical protein PNA2_1463 [Pyrococcus sp. NA2]|nr:hypothetical protein PNA2_1463 [Pyrococcus sp. NA2]